MGMAPWAAVGARGARERLGPDKHEALAMAIVEHAPDIGGNRPAPPFRVRPAGYADLEVVLEMWGTMMAEHELSDPRIRLSDAALPSYRSYLGYHLNNSGSRVLVADARDAMAGFCLVTITHNLKMFLPERYGYLSDLYVRPDARRQGVGRALVAHASAAFSFNIISSTDLARRFGERSGSIPTTRACGLT
jgi:ribosomal protein S18 acetylase RimI-like enzyme